ncbi:MFS transporter [Streptomyces sp. JNUCC 64]
MRWLGAYTASLTGDVAYYFVLAWAVSRVAGPAQVGLVLAVGAVPRAVLMLGGGALADRFGPRRVLIGSDLVRTVVVLAVALVTWATGPGLWPLCLLALVFGAVDAVFMPAVGALPPRIAPVAQLARIQALRGLAVRLGNATGPLLAAAVVAAGGAAAGFAVAGALFAVSLALIAAVRITPLREPSDSRTAGTTAGEGTGETNAPEDEQGTGETYAPEDEQPKGRGRGARPGAARAFAGLWGDTREGLRLLRGDRRLTRLVAILALAEMCFGGPFAAGLVLLTDARGWGPTALGWMLAAFSAGGAVTGLTLAVLPRVPRAATVTAAALLTTAVAVTALGRTGDPATALLLCGVVGGASGLAGTLAHTLVQRATEPRYLGRITAVTTLCTLGLAPLLYPLTGLVTAWWGVGAFLLGCGAICATAGVLALTAPARRAEP